MNLNNGFRSADGPDMYDIGKIGVADDTTPYMFIPRSNDICLFEFTTSPNGNVWVIISTDSGFEARTVLYYKKVAITFIPWRPSEQVSLLGSLARVDKIIDFHPGQRTGKDG